VSVPPDDEMEAVLLYQPVVREEARRLAKDLRAFPDQARSLPRRKLAALEAAAEVLEMIAGPEIPQRRPGQPRGAPAAATGTGRWLGLHGARPHRADQGRGLSATRHKPHGVQPPHYFTPRHLPLKSIGYATSCHYAIKYIAPALQVR